MKRLPFDASLPPDDREVGEARYRHLVRRPELRPALRELRLEDERGGALDRERDRDADDDLVEAEANADSTMNRETPAPASMPAPKPSHTSSPWYAATKPA